MPPGPIFKVYPKFDQFFSFHITILIQASKVFSLDYCRSLPAGLLESTLTPIQLILQGSTKQTWRKQQKHILSVTPSAL